MRKIKTRYVLITFVSKFFELLRNKDEYGGFNKRLSLKGKIININSTEKSKPFKQYRNSLMTGVKNDKTLFVFSKKPCQFDLSLYSFYRFFKRIC